MAGRFENKVVVVTGGGRGIGRDTAILVAREGARVVINDLGGAVRGRGEIDLTVAQGVVDEIRALGGTAIANGADVGTMAGGQSVVEDAINEFGRVDALILSAGIVRPARLAEMEEDLWDELLRVNLKSVFAVSKAAVPHMIAQRSGSIVTFSSPAGLGQHYMSGYSASKEGLVGWTRSVARELGEHGIRCNALRPAAIDTRMALPEMMPDMAYVAEQGLPIFGTHFYPGGDDKGPPSGSGQVAAVAAWLCLPEAANINGRELFIAGGHVALFAEPELIRSRFRFDGWDLDSLASPAISAHLTFGQRNLFGPDAIAESKLSGLVNPWATESVE